ncbi:MAG: hypothetical protein ACRC5R_01825 [Mycoplasmatales bacterium]
MIKNIKHVIIVVLIFTFIFLFFNQSFNKRTKEVVLSELTEKIDFYRDKKHKYTNLVELDENDNKIKTTKLDVAYPTGSIDCGNHQYIRTKYHEYIDIDKTKKTVKVLTDELISRSGTIQSITCNEDSSLFNINVSGLPDGKYNSYLLYNGIKYQSTGGLIGNAIIRDDLIYFLEDSFPDTQMKLTIYDLDGNLVKQSTSDNVQKTRLSSRVFIDQNNNINFIDGNKVLIIDQELNETTKVLNGKIDAYTRIIVYQEQKYITSNTGIIYQLNDDYSVIEVGNVQNNNLAAIDLATLFLEEAGDYFIFNGYESTMNGTIFYKYKFDFKTMSASILTTISNTSREVMPDISVDIK